jgi:branched-chain amino acid transport system permease protein
VAGAALIGPAQQYFAYRFGASQLYLVAYAALFLLVIYFLPNGIVPSLARRLGRPRQSSTAGAAHDQVATDSVFSGGDIG